MIAKSKEGEDHLINLKRLFDRLKEYKLRLNPAKCTFGARSGKLLGFVVSERGIEVDPDKVKAIKGLPPPSTIRENAAMEWDHECQKAFDTIKAYLIQPPILIPPAPNRPLILYLTVRRQSLGCMLGQEDESTRTERAIYNFSKKFTERESNYPEIEKMCCALVWVMQRLRQHTFYHTIRLLSKADPLRYLSAPHFGPLASHGRTFDQSSGHYSSSGNQRRTCGHGTTSNRRRAWSTEKGRGEPSEE
ncbi:hypothetical protein CRG98_033665 [Punica granatum]|uniref:Reverse transcriptase/retrotransposon-derived protein RNase H-like domain-containing protein n=1 Tax=Punica granatum TaxID=22663 RepID=A0A2I0IPN1_PUNGR|nr:hypothetical protein CRG98_033665 [Punica granatum]